MRIPNSIYMVGIGGIGISALARILRAQGKRVSGSDLVHSELTDDLENEGIKVLIGAKKENLPRDTDLLIYSVAVPHDNPERAWARELNIPELSYPQALGELAKNYKVIAVAGTNGKTTTTAMIGQILESAGLDPTVIVGSTVLTWHSNARVGKGKYLVLEADEYRRAFLNYSPDIAVIANIAADHLDYFRDLEDITSAFVEFTNKIKHGGTLIYNLEDPTTAQVASRFLGNKLGFEIKDYRLKIPGRFNQANASAAAIACRVLGISEEIVKTALKNFSGTWRRFEKVGKVGKTEIISDYAHHPAGVRVTLETAAQVYAGKKILAVFQPHQRNRTKNLSGDFVKAFCESPLSDFIITEIFDVIGREEAEDQNVSSNELVHEISKCDKNIAYARNLSDCEKMIREKLSNYDVVLIMGAGDIYKVANRLKK